ncbi:ER lumen protein-retaining receptor [Tanacetum coccineum]|uniref:ER lumen protein-retaining receptor n=1 Tax=Tanacetum coccineum TaxID=301880 RepID=A0ABQ5I9Z1_9ASTR
MNVKAYVGFVNVGARSKSLLNVGDRASGVDNMGGNRVVRTMFVILGLKTTWQLRCIIENSGTVCAGLCHSLLGYIYRFYLTIQYRHEVDLPWELFLYCMVMWTFSLYLEAVAILPQLVLLQRTRNIDNLTGQYVFLLGAYRGLYILNWIYRYFTEPHYVHWITWIAGLVQTLLYADFFYYYFESWKNNVRLQLPA